MHTVLHLSRKVSQTDIYTVLCRRPIEFHNETKLFVPFQMLCQSGGYMRVRIDVQTLIRK